MIISLTRMDYILKDEYGGGGGVGGGGVDGRGGG